MITPFQAGFVRSIAHSNQYYIFVAIAPESQKYIKIYTMIVLLNSNKFYRKCLYYHEYIRDGLDDVSLVVDISQD